MSSSPRQQSDRFLKKTASVLQHHCQWMKYIDWRILLLVAVLSSFGVVAVTSASMSIAHENIGDPWHYTKRYVIYWSMGFLVAMFIAAIPTTIWEEYGSLFLIIALALLACVLIPGLGRRVNGSQRWLQLGPLAIQASELVKFCVIVFYSSYLCRRSGELLQDWRGVFKPLLILGMIVFLLLLEPDFGASVVLAATVMAMLFLAGVRLWQFLLLFAVALVGMFLIATSSDYRVQRLITFLDPWAVQYEGGYQLVQSLIAFGRGEWFGVGLGNSVQKLFYLPEAHTDFIFAIIAEEFGLLGVVVVLVTFLLLVLLLFRIAGTAMKQQQPFAMFASFGIGIMFAAQAFINLGVASGLLPTKGLTMPFISYGGSSLLASGALIALALRIDAELRLQITQQLDGTTKKVGKRKAAVAPRPSISGRRNLAAALLKGQA